MTNLKMAVCLVIFSPLLIHLFSKFEHISFEDCLFLNKYMKSIITWNGLILIIKYGTLIILWAPYSCEKTSKEIWEK